jgi:FKBP-type peptidyl-prolyl cis-trans isomerase
MKRFSIIISISLLIGCSHQKNAGTTNNGYITTTSGLQYKIIQKGSGPQAKEGQEVLIRETTSYLNGTVLYSNEHSGSAVKVLIGGNQATHTVDEGLRGMQEGEIRRLIASPNLVKRTTYPLSVSPDSTLTIKIILTKIL